MLRGKVALVAESAFGIGAKIAKRFAYEGAHVVLVSDCISNLTVIYDEIKRLGGSATIAQTDMNSMNSIGELFVSVNSIFKCLDILVGGISHFASVNLLVDYTESNWIHVMNMNLHTNWRLLKIFDPLLKSSSAGRVIMNICDYKDTSYSFCGPYLISELSLEKMLEVYATESAHTNIKANLVSLANIELMKDPDALNNVNNNEITDIFVKLASEHCVFTGKKHYAQY